MAHLQRGNILFLILLAVILFAALSYAVTGGMRGGGKDAGDDNAKLAASNIMQAGSLMANAVNRMMLTNGCKESELSFEDGYDTGYVNNARADGSCKLFGILGGGLEYPVPDSGWFEATKSSVAPAFYGKWFFYNFVCVPAVGTGADQNCWNDNSADSDLVAYLPFLTKNICKAINDAVGIRHHSDGDALIAGGGTINYNGAYKFTGSFAGTSTNAIVGSYYNGGGGYDAFKTKYAGCFQQDVGAGPWGANPSGQYVFYQVLLAR